MMLYVERLLSFWRPLRVLQKHKSVSSKECVTAKSDSRSFGSFNSTTALSSAGRRSLAQTAPDGSCNADLEASSEAATSLPWINAKRMNSATCSSSSRKKNSSFSAKTQLCNASATPLRRSTWHFETSCGSRAARTPVVRLNTTFRNSELFAVKFRRHLENSTPQSSSSTSCARRANAKRRRRVTSARAAKASAPAATRVTFWRSMSAVTLIAGWPSPMAACAAAAKPPASISTLIVLSSHSSPLSFAHAVRFTSADRASLRVSSSFLGSAKAQSSSTPPSAS
mmetsp:Transcript_6599/g.21319  ORF Transcript_6599/g.21319 Transcript_6599/m.21319 type:complete len:283 (+) Transcript_6599:463-1311(+)